jgi:hypothetical protein
MFQMLLLANGHRNLLRVPGGVGFGLGLGLGVPTAPAVSVGVAAGLSVGLLDACGSALPLGCSRAYPPEPVAGGYCVLDGAGAAACPHAATAIARLARNVSREPLLKLKMCGRRRRWRPSRIRLFPN